MKKSAIAGALALLLGVAAKGWAANTDQLTVTITPTVNLNIAITTTTVQWNSGDTDLNLSLNLGTTDYLVRPATVTYTGTFAGAEVDVQGVDNMPEWSFDTDAVPAEDELQVYALFSNTSQPAAPGLSDFTDGTGAAGDQILSSGARRYGQSGGDDGGNDSAFQEASYNSASENLSPGNARHLWLRVDLPPTSTSTNVQTFSVVLTATQNN